MKHTALLRCACPPPPLPSLQHATALPTSRAVACPGLMIAPSSVPGAGWGLFSSTGIPAGGFVALLRGEWVRCDDATDAFTDDGYDLVTDFHVCHQTSIIVRESLVENPLLAANEPPVAMTANAFFAEWGLEQEVICGGAVGQRVVALALHACSEGISAGAEVFVDYGGGYDGVRRAKGYKRGTRGTDVPFAHRQWPAESLGSRTPANAFARW